jgi:hypothetical protein
MPQIFTDLCDVERRSATAQGYGSKPSYATHLTGQPFLLVARQQRGFNSITAEWIVSTRYTAHFPAETDIREGDRLSNVSLNREADSEDVDGTFQVDGGVLPRRGRGSRVKIVELRRVS